MACCHFAPLGFLPGAGLAPLLRLRQILEALLLVEAGSAFLARLEVQSERPLDGDPAEAEAGGGKDVADDSFLILAIPGEHARVAVPALGE